MPTSHESLSLAALLEQYHQSAVSRGLRPRSIADAENADAEKCLRRVAPETGACRLVALSPVVLQDWIRESDLKPVTLRTILRNHGNSPGEERHARI